MGRRSPSTQSKGPKRLLSTGLPALVPSKGNTLLLRAICAALLGLGSPRDSLSQSVPVWNVEADPQLSMGEAEGADEYVFYHVRDATRLSDGTLVVVLYFRNLFELRYYDSSGRHITSAGRYGNGPFEMGGSGFGGFARLSGDSVQVVGWDRRFSVFGPRGEEARSSRFSLPPPPPVLFPDCQVDDNHLGLYGFYPGASQEPRGASPGNTVPLWIHDLEAGTTKQVGSVWTATRGDVDDDGLFLHAPFDPDQQWAAGGGIFWFGNPEEPEIEGHGVDGARVAITLVGNPGRVTKEDERRWKEYRLGTASTPEMERGYRRWHRRVEFPEYLPFYQRLFVDEDGRLWVLRYEPPWSEAPFNWDVFDARGRRIAEVSIPFSVLGSSIRKLPLYSNLLEAGSDYILVLDKDDLGIERIKKYRLGKGGAG